MNNEPVAYAWCKNGKMLSAMIGKYEPIKTDPYWLENGFDAIPLYTTPQIKKLSDEEIIEIRKNTKANSTNNWADSLAFAKAILKKAIER